jgi:hypothetical protein
MKLMSPPLTDPIENFPSDSFCFHHEKVHKSRGQALDLTAISRHGHVLLLLPLAHLALNFHIVLLHWLGVVKVAADMQLLGHLVDICGLGGYAGNSTTKSPLLPLLSLDAVLQSDLSAAKPQKKTRTTALGRQQCCRADAKPTGFIRINHVLFLTLLRSYGENMVRKVDVLSAPTDSG